VRVRKVADIRLEDREIEEIEEIEETKV